MSEDNYESMRRLFIEADAEVGRLRTGIIKLAEECEKVPPANEAMNAWQRAHAAFARELRALLASVPRESKG